MRHEREKHSVLRAKRLSRVRNVRKFLVPTPALATGSGALSSQGAQYQAPSPARSATHPPAQDTAVPSECDYRSLTVMDPSFDVDQFLTTAHDLFFKVQGAWNKQDSAGLRALCGEQLLQTWE